MPRPRVRLALCRLEDRTTPSTFFPITSPRDLVFDAARNRLYITTEVGSLARFDVAANAFLPAFEVGVQHNGADITPDGRYLYIAENQSGPSEGFFHKVDLAPATPTATLLTFSGAGASWDVAVGPAGVALGTPRHSGNAQLIDIATNVVTASSRMLAGRTTLSRSADRSLVYLNEENTAGGRASTYRFASGFSPFEDTRINLNFVDSAVSRDGTRIATDIDNATVVVAADFAPVATLDNCDGGKVFDPTRDILYAVNSTTDELIAFDTNTWREKYRLPIGRNVGSTHVLGEGVTAISADGNTVFLLTQTGLLRIDLPIATLVASQLRLSDVSRYRLTGTATTVTVTAFDPAGNVVPNYTGTVTFTSTDPAAVLPAAYTFTPADGGTRTFPITWTTTGSRTLTVRDTANNFVVTTPAVTVHNALNPLIPVPNRRGLAYDTVHNLLLISTSAGTIERYDPATRSMLAPLVGGGANYYGADVTPDGSAVYVAEGHPGLVRSAVRRIDPLTGATSSIGHVGDFGTWDLVVGANGTGLATYLDSQDSTATLDRLDIAAGTLTSTGRIVMQRTHLARGTSRNLFFAAQSGGGRSFFTYDPVAGAIIAETTVGDFLNDTALAVNHNGTLVALVRSSGLVLMTPTLGTVRTHPNINGGVIFDPNRDLVYGVDSTDNQVIAYNTTNGAEVWRQSLGEDLPPSIAFGSGATVVSDDGQWMFVSTPTGVKTVQIGTRLFIGTSFVTDPGGQFFVLVNPRLPTGANDLSYRGTVTFMSSDPNAVLPAPYTFTATDAAQGKQFTLSMNTVGAYTVTVSDNSFSIPSTANVTVRPARVLFTQANSGAVQRSRVTDVRVTFAGNVAFPGGAASAFQLSRVGGGPVGGFTATVQPLVGFARVTLSNFTGAETEFGSLVDGRYVLRILAAAVTAGGATLDGNGDGVAGDDYLLTGSVANGLFRLFGDADGSGVVNAADYAAFRPAFGSSTGQAAYLDYFDFDNDGVINAFDFSRFRTRFGAPVP